jgi:uncharacterized protein (DUF934 family)
MPLLDRSGMKLDLWSTDAEASHRLVPLGELELALEARGNAQQFGIRVANTATVADMAGALTRTALISIAFPAYADGRGFSIAKRLRRAGYTGILRAEGPLIADQFAYALACGFDELALPDALIERQPLDQWLKAAAAFSATYQRGYSANLSILDQRKRARSHAQVTHD